MPRIPGLDERLGAAEVFEPGERVAHTARAKFQGMFGTVIESKLNEGGAYYAVTVKWDDGRVFSHHSFRLRRLNLIEKIGDLDRPG